MSSCRLVTLYSPWCSYSLSTRVLCDGDVDSYSKYLDHGQSRRDCVRSSRRRCPPGWDVAWAAAKTDRMYYVILHAPLATGPRHMSSPQLLPPSSASLSARPQTHTLTHHHGLLHRQCTRSAAPGQPTLGRQPKLHRSAAHHARPQGASLHLLRCEATRIPDKAQHLTRRTTSRSRTRTDIPLSNAPERRSRSRTAKVCKGPLHQGSSTEADGSDYGPERTGPLPHQEQDDCDPQDLCRRG